METQPINFEVTARDGEARAGVLTTPRALIETPVFMPVGTAGEATPEEARASMELTLRWAKRSRDAFDRYRTATSWGSKRGSSPTTGSPSGQPGWGGAVREGAEADGTSALPGSQALFGIVQGASYLDLRRESLERTVEIGFDGYAIGGLSVGEEKPVMLEVIEEIAP